MNDTQIATPERVIVMKSKLSIWVAASRIQGLIEVLEKGTGHRFVNIDGQVLNTAEMEGIYTPEQYAELQKIKEGFRMCEFKKWHGRKEECQCKLEQWKRHQDEMRKIRDKDENKPLTPEERKRNIEALTKGNEYAALNGSELFRRCFIDGNRSGRKLRKSTIAAWELETGKKADVAGLAIDRKA